MKLIIVCWNRQLKRPQFWIFIVYIMFPSFSRSYCKAIRDFILCYFCFDEKSKFQWLTYSQGYNQSEHRFAWYPSYGSMNAHLSSPVWMFLVYMVIYMLFACLPLNIRWPISIVLLQPILYFAAKCV